MARLSLRRTMHGTGIRKDKAYTESQMKAIVRSGVEDEKSVKEEKEEISKTELPKEDEELLEREDLDDDLEIDIELEEKKEESKKETSKKKASPSVSPTPAPTSKKSNDKKSSKKKSSASSTKKKRGRPKKKAD